MKFPEDSVQSQYAASPIIRRLIDFLNQETDPVQDINLFYEMIFDIYSAQGYGLDNWGRILGLGRVLQVEIEDYFGFNGSELHGFGLQPFYYPGLTQNYPLDDDMYRRLLLCKAAANICASDQASLIALLKLFFEDRGNMYIIQTDVMEASLRFEFELNTVEKSLLKQDFVPPRPAGVMYRWIEAMPDRIFGFNGSLLQPFNEGVFYRGGVLPPIPPDPEPPDPEEELWTPYDDIYDMILTWVDDTSEVDQFGATLTDNSAYAFRYQQYGNRPITTVENQINGLRAYHIDGTAHSGAFQMIDNELAGYICSGAEELWCFYVYVPDGAKTTTSTIFGITFNYGNDDYAFWANLQNYNLSGQFPAGVPAFLIRGIRTNTLTIDRLSGSLTPETGTTTCSVRYNFVNGNVFENIVGKEAKTNIFPNPTRGLVTNEYRNPPIIGTLMTNTVNSRANYALRGWIGEVIFGKGTLTQDQVDKLTGYLCHKWGNTEKLPANHPYKNDPPMKIV